MSYSAKWQEVRAARKARRAADARVQARARGREKAARETAAGGDEAA